MTVVAASEPRQTQHPELWAALLAGEAVWAPEAETPPARIRVAAVVEVAALAFVAVTLWFVVVARLEEPTRDALRAVAAAAVTVASVALAVRPVEIVRGLPPRPASLGARMTWRLTAALVIVVGSAVVLPGAFALALWPIGVAAGADAVIGSRAVGVDVRPGEWWRRTLTAPWHLAVLGAVVALLITRSDARIVIELLGSVLAFELGSLAAWLTAEALVRVGVAIDAERAAAQARATDAAHRRLAHWIHDDVCADLQLTAMRLRTGALESGAVSQELADLDHRLRLRQQREIIDSGQARLAELIQPYVRRAQSSGAAITEVPTLNDAALRLEPAAAALFARAASTLTSNALNAGATELGFRIHHTDEVVMLTISDDAGGFALDEVPAGRGLDTLISDLGPEHLIVRKLLLGSQVTAIIERHHPQDVSRREVGRGAGSRR